MEIIGENIFSHLHLKNCFLLISSGMVLSFHLGLDCDSLCENRHRIFSLPNC